MTPSELKRKTFETNPFFFSRKTMKFFGDTMKNYGCQKAVIDTRTKENVKCWELYRKHPVKTGLKDSAFFDQETFEQVFPRHE